MKLNMSFSIKDTELLGRYNKIWDKVSNSVKQVFHGEPVYNEKHPKTKIRSCKDKINTNCHNNRMMKEGSHCICLSVKLIDSIFKKGKKNYP